MNTTVKKIAKQISLLIAVSIFVTGCAFVSLHLTPHTGLFKEHVLEGKGRGKILIIDVTGLISERTRSGRVVNPKTNMVSDIKEQFDIASKDKAIKGVLLRVNSPGGTVSASDAIYHIIKTYRDKTDVKVYTSIIGIGTSGGIYVSSATEKIYAEPTSVTGSIGVIAFQMNVKGLLEKLGIEDKSYKSGDKKGMFSPIKPDTPEEQAIIQSMLDSFHKRFKNVVFENRKDSISREKLDELADGRPFTAQQAHKEGLIDGVMYLDETIALLKKELVLKEAQIVRYKRPGSFVGSIYASGAPEPFALPILGRTMDALDGVKFMYIWPSP